MVSAENSVKDQTPLEMPTVLRVSVPNSVVAPPPGNDGGVNGSLMDTLQNCTWGVFPGSPP